MKFEAGNQFWKARSSHGRKPIFANPDVLWEAACEYFEWNEANPLWEIKSYQYQGVPVQDQIPKMRAMTEAGLCVFLDITTTCWADYKNKADFSEVTTRICDIIRTQKFEGAAAEFLNANIIARDLGLSDKSEVNNNHNFKDMSDLELENRIKALENELKSED